MILKQLDLLNFSIISPHILKENLVRMGNRILTFENIQKISE